MKTDIHKIPLIPDNKLFYTIAISFYECYDQLYMNEKFLKDVDECMNRISNEIKLWRESFIMSEYTGDEHV